MYMVCVYDVDEKRCAKVMKVLRNYLFHIQCLKGVLHQNHIETYYVIYEKYQSKLIQFCFTYLTMKSKCIKNHYISLLPDANTAANTQPAPFSSRRRVHSLSVDPVVRISSINRTDLLDFYFFSGI